MLWRTGTLRLPPFHHMSYVTPVAMPVRPARVMSSSARVPSRSIAAMIAGIEVRVERIAEGRHEHALARRALLVHVPVHLRVPYAGRAARVTMRVSGCVSMNQSRLLSWPA